MPAETSVPPREPAVDDDLSTTQNQTKLVEAPDSITMDMINVIRGFCMGAADTVPGVSGGTIALILGHYHRLVQSIGNVDSTLVNLAMNRKFSAAAKQIDLRFLVALGAGIGIGVATLSKLMHWLLDHQMPQTLAVFLGLMLASVWIVKSHVKHWSSDRWTALAIGAIVAAGITLIPTGGGNTGLLYLFFSATVAICAMILPGISGAFVLLLFGIYHDITGLIKEAVRGNITLDALTRIAVFSLGCLVGLLAFSRLLRWLLDHHRDLTMATLMGLMIGSLQKLWPLQVPTPQTADLELKLREFQWVSPSQWDGNLVWLTCLAVGAGIAVLVIERLASSTAISQRISAPKSS